jgi:hypothetical protein
MRQLIFVTLVVGVVLFFPTERHKTIQLPHYTQQHTIIIDRPEVAQRTTPSRGDLRNFMRALSKIESNHDHTIVNRYGMMGRYQFSPKTVQALGFDVSQEEFLTNPELQDRVLIAYLRDNRRTLRKTIQHFDGVLQIDGTTITESGILAGAHLVGVGGVLSYFYPEKYSYRVADGNGVSIELYLKKFSGYTIPKI